MKLMERQYLATPYGSRRFSAWLRTQGYRVNGNQGHLPAPQD